jgi:WD40 repeat protein
MKIKLIPYQLICLLLLIVCTSGGQQSKPVKAYGLWTLDISHDDNYIAAGGDDSMLRIFTKDLKPYKIENVGKRGMIKCMQWHPKQNLLAISSRQDVWVADPETGKEIILEGELNGSRTIAWNYNGELLAAAAGSGIVWIWNRDGKLLRKIQKTSDDGSPDKKDFLGLDWHPSKNILTTVGDEIRIFDTAGKQLNVFKHREQRAGLLTVKWHPAGNFFVIGDYGHPKEGIPVLLQFWNPDGKLIKEWNGSKYEFRNIRWNKQGTLLATGSDALRIWSQDGKLLYTGKEEGNKVLWGVDWVSDSKKIITVSYDSGNIQLWNDKAKLLKTIN